MLYNHTSSLTRNNRQVAMSQCTPDCAVYGHSDDCWNPNGLEGKNVISLFYLMYLKSLAVLKRYTMSLRVVLRFFKCILMQVESFAEINN